MKRASNSLFVLTVAMLFFGSAAFVSAQFVEPPPPGPPDSDPINPIPQPCIGENCTVTLTNPLPIDSAENAIQRLISIVAFTIAPVIVTIMVMIGAFQMLFASGDPEKFARGKKTVLFSIIGYAVLLLATGMVYLIKDVLRP